MSPTGSYFYVYLAACGDISGSCGSFKRNVVSRSLSLGTGLTPSPCFLVPHDVKSHMLPPHALICFVLSTLPEWMENLSPNKAFLPYIFLLDMTSQQHKSNWEAGLSASCCATLAHTLQNFLHFSTAPHNPSTSWRSHLLPGLHSEF